MIFPMLYDVHDFNCIFSMARKYLKENKKKRKQSYIRLMMFWFLLPNYSAGGEIKATKLRRVKVHNMYNKNTRTIMYN